MTSDWKNLSRLWSILNPAYAGYCARLACFLDPQYVAKPERHLELLQLAIESNCRVPRCLLSCSPVLSAVETRLNGIGFETSGAFAFGSVTLELELSRDIDVKVLVTPTSSINAEWTKLDSLRAEALSFHPGYDISFDRLSFLDIPGVVCTDMDGTVMSAIPLDVRISERLLRAKAMVLERIQGRNFAHRFAYLCKCRARFKHLKKTRSSVYSFYGLLFWAYRCLLIAVEAVGAVIVSPKHILFAADRIDYFFQMTALRESASKLISVYRSHNAAAHLPNPVEFLCMEETVEGLMKRTLAILLEQARYVRT